MVVDVSIGFDLGDINGEVHLVWQANIDVDNAGDLGTSFRRARFSEWVGQTEVHVGQREVFDHVSHGLSGEGNWNGNVL